ncbi:hypothetical protein AcW1_006224 [Taiwanofungus camphoratus]|nr:hypothetical protein AcW2_004982 [Antrodia cinnamomea]KAI0934832.1 hypothetical protein AcV5_006542 [Antrodia cinnamomea]KAI0949885.1 hypothetical protein AcV7_008524 [Antrodia cinnamomea]KAI0958029.1 hypothetical protein AcW1_006224 [Antrodia cinnamomea]
MPSGNPNLSKKRRISLTRDRIPPSKKSRGPSSTEASQHFAPMDSASEDEAHGKGGRKRPGISSAAFWVEVPAMAPNTRVLEEVADPRYEIFEDEVIEDENLLIPGESVPDELDDSSSVPIRVLNDFNIYEWNSLRLMQVDELLSLGSEDGYVYGASGIVKPFMDDDDDGYESQTDDLQFDDEPRVKLSEILEFNVHYVDTRDHPRLLRLDPKIYIRTVFAWYVLDTPSKSYFQFFVEFWIKHRMLHLVISASLADITIDHNHFVESLKVTPDSPDAVALAIKMIGRELTEQDLQSDDVKLYVVTVIKELLQDNTKLRHAIGHSPLICALLGDINPNLVKGIQKMAKTALSKHVRDVEKDVLLHRNRTVVTPSVAHIAHGLFVQSLLTTGQSLVDSRLSDEGMSDIGCDDHVHYTDPSLIKWVKGSCIGPNHYSSVIIDGARYSVGDTVIVEKGEDGNHIRQRNAATEEAHCQNSLANNKWFCKICYMFEVEEVIKSKYGRATVNRKYFHGQWLQHGSQMLLQETAHSKGLFYLNECDDLPLECIFSRCNLKVLKPNEDEPLDESAGDGNNFHTGLTWDQDNSAIIQMSDHDILSALQTCNKWQQCVSCGIHIIHKQQAVWKVLQGGGISRHGIEYHIHDFIYLRPQHFQNQLYDIAQIQEIVHDNHRKLFTVNVCLYGRYALIAQSQKGTENALHDTDNCHLFHTDTIVTVDLSQIDGKVYVIASKSLDKLDKWLQNDDHFYVHSQAKSVDVQGLSDLEALTSIIKQCKTCFQQRHCEFEKIEHHLQCNGPLRGLELFAGAGGLSTGLELSGFVKTRWAIEFSPSAALTYMKNHPETVVYNQDTNLLLQYAIDDFEGKKPKPLMSLRNDIREELAPMPKQGEVDFIYGGPPCQSFSAMNHHKKADDIRNTLVCNMLSYLEFYRPYYFLLENVTGLIFYPLNGHQSGRAVVGGVKMGVVKFIIRTLVCLGYQVHFKVLQAGQYGAPQARKRVIFWGARRDVPLPGFPLPTHCFPKPVESYKLPTGDVLRPVTRAKPDEEDGSVYQACAPFLPVTVNDAIGDLPRFDWINPHIEARMTKRDKEDIVSRLADGIPRFDAQTSPERKFPGFSSPAPYLHPPLNRYQKWIRAGAGNKVRHQYTRRFPARIVERVANVPIRAGAYHVDLPPQLRINRLFGPDKKPKSQYRGVYGRIDGDSFFRTAMTTVAPNCKGGALLHPTVSCSLC